MSTVLMLSTIYRTVAHPSNYDGSEQDRLIGYFNTPEEAAEQGDLWVKGSHQPCRGGHCGCVWTVQIAPITVGKRERNF